MRTAGTSTAVIAEAVTMIVEVAPTRIAGTTTTVIGVAMIEAALRMMAEASCLLGEKATTVAMTIVGSVRENLMDISATISATIDEVVMIATTTIATIVAAVSATNAMTAIAGMKTGLLSEVEAETVVGTELEVKAQTPEFVMLQLLLQRVGLHPGDKQIVVQRASLVGVGIAAKMRK